MTGEQQGPLPFAERLDHLFRTITRPDGKPYSNRAAAELLAEQGVAISHTHVGNLRKGRADPRRAEMLAFARMFGQPPGYFTDEVAATSDQRSQVVPEGVTPAPDAERLARALQDPRILSVAMRMGDGALSQVAMSAIADMVEHVVRLEEHGRGQVSDDRPES